MTHESIIESIEEMGLEIVNCDVLVSDFSNQSWIDFEEGLSVIVVKHLQRGWVCEIHHGNPAIPYYWPNGQRPSVALGEEFDGEVNWVCYGASRFKKCELTVNEMLDKIKKLL